ncbi:sugar transferase [Pseudonocardia lacus]|uniref:sugar transferase n=1 Tax=Pseudonocardia lacus TaxID=2835865 RepID=UPI001BDC469A|nr:sugar transferase [Pseudonocardia lacus]
MPTRHDLGRPEPAGVLAGPVPLAAADGGAGGATPSVAYATERPVSGWEALYRVAVATSDLTLLILCVTAGIALGPSAAQESEAAARASVMAGAATALAVVLGLLFARVWDARVLGTGTYEFRRLYRALIGSAGVLGLGAFALQIDSARPWVFGVVPGFAALCLPARYGLRKLLHSRRVRGRCLVPVLAVGSEPSVADLVRRTQRDPHFGWRITGACVPSGTGGAGTSIEGVPVLGDLDAVAGVARRGQHRIVAVAPAPGWGPGRLQQLAWQLETAPSVELAVDPGLMEIAGPRLHIAPVDGLPMLLLSMPRFTGVARLLKNVVDRAGAFVILLLAAPVIVAVAVAVRLDGGPVFYRQTRVGENGRTFRMVKFRSMAVGADKHVAALAGSNEAAGPLFKMRHDPRITRVGRVLRKYSIDELPQLFNVLCGSMSLVGPRPPLPAEVATYGPDARRRLLVRPGMTGLWQVSGRSDLSWEESVRLDLRYVENWTLALDASILWKTAGAVLRGRGAY